MKPESEILREIANWVNFEDAEKLIKIAAKLERIKKGLSDEEIEKKYPNKLFDIKHIHEWADNDLRQEGAKWYRDKIKQLMK